MRLIISNKQIQSTSTKKQTLLCFGDINNGKWKWRTYSKKGYIYRIEFYTKEIPYFYDSVFHGKLEYEHIDFKFMNNKIEKTKTFKQGIYKDDNTYAVFINFQNTKIYNIVLRFNTDIELDYDADTIIEEGDL